ncbi:MAG: hypothetical protein ABGW78_04140 [Pirellulales bacterium]
MTTQIKSGNTSINTQRYCLVVAALVELGWLFFLSWMAVKA